jgi:hypothetical protein
VSLVSLLGESPLSFTGLDLGPRPFESNECYGVRIQLSADNYRVSVVSVSECVIFKSNLGNQNKVSNSFSFLVVVIWNWETPQTPRTLGQAVDHSSVLDAVEATKGSEMT